MTCSQAERNLVAVDRVHLSVVDAHTHVACIAAREGPLGHAVHDALHDGRNEACIDGTAHDAVVDDELATPFQRNLLLVPHVHLELLVAKLVGVGLGHSLLVRLYNEVHLAKLARSARLLLVAVVGTGCLGDGLAVRNLGLLIHDFQLFVVLDAPLQCAQVELALARYYRLLQLLGLLNHPRWVFLVHAVEYGAQLFNFALILGAYRALILGRRILDEVKCPVHTLVVQCVASAHVFQFHSCAYVAGFYLVDRSLDLPAHDRYLCHAFL